MNILDKIIAHKKEEVEVRRMMISETALQNCSHFNRACLSLKQNLLIENATGIIAEFKRRSPSKGFINQHADAVTVTAAYTQAGASGLSILTDHEFFGGSNQDLITSRLHHIPILRKDFIIDRYQLTESKAMGADVILLIAACLTRTQVEELAAYAKQLGLEVLLELHDESELDHICEAIDMVGINNRNLKTFKVDIQHSIRLSKAIPSGKVKIAESGISDSATIKIFKDAGYRGFLIGENFMKENDPGNAFEDFVKKLQ